MSGLSDADKKLVDLLDALCPMHVLADATGHVLHAGPALAKLNDGKPLTGTRFLEFAELRRPHGATSMEALLKLSGVKLHFSLREPPRTELKGVIVPLADGRAVLNLSLGISVVDAVSEYALTSADFAATDLAVELLFLVEAKSAAMEASQRLNLRLQGARIAAEEQAFTDTLTGLKNRRAMEHIATRLIDGEKKFALMHLDLDHFKAVNDTFGHAAGDIVLLAVARALVGGTRDADTVIRVGGDEFVVIFPNLDDEDQVSHIARRLIRAVEEPVSYQGKTCRISASVGITFSSVYESPDLAQMIADADTALYAAKARGRGCHLLYSPDLGQMGNAAPAPPGVGASG